MMTMLLMMTMLFMFILLLLMKMSGRVKGKSLDNFGILFRAFLEFLER